jgi:hypothetical protein
MYSRDLGVLPISGLPDCSTRTIKPLGRSHLIARCCPSFVTTRCMIIDATDDALAIVHNCPTAGSKANQDTEAIPTFKPLRD